MIRNANAGDLSEIITLWNTCFPDESGFNAYFFENVFDLRNVLLLEKAGRIAAMTQMIPFHMRDLNGVDEVFTYIYGACTHPEFRRQHLMSELLNRSFQLDRAQGRVGSILIPAEPWLFDFYAQFGYQPVFMLSTETADDYQPDHGSFRLSMLSKEHAEPLDALYEAAFQPDRLHLTRTREIWEQQIAMFQTIGSGCFALWDGSGTLCAYAFVWKPEQEKVYAQELIARDAESRAAMLKAIHSATGAARVMYSGVGEAGKPLGCMKRYDGMVTPDVYMNLMLN